MAGGITVSALEHSLRSFSFEEVLLTAQPPLRGAPSPQETWTGGQLEEQELRSMSRKNPELREQEGLPRSYAAGRKEGRPEVGREGECGWVGSLASPEQGGRRLR